MEDTFEDNLNSIIQQPTYTIDHVRDRDHPFKITIPMREICNILDTRYMGQPEHERNNTVIAPLVEFLSNVISAHVDQIIETLVAHVEQLRQEFAASEGAHSSTNCVHNDTSRQIVQLMSVFMLYKLGTEEQKNNAEFVFEWEPHGGFKFTIHNALDAPIMNSSVLSVIEEYGGITQQLSKTLTIFSSGIYQCAFHSDEESDSDAEPDNDAESDNDVDDNLVFDPAIHAHAENVHAENAHAENNRNRDPRSE